MWTQRKFDSPGAYIKKVIRPKKEAKYLFSSLRASTLFSAFHNVVPNANSSNNIKANSIIHFKKDHNINEKKLIKTASKNHILFNKT